MGDVGWPKPLSLRWKKHTLFTRGSAEVEEMREGKRRSGKKGERESGRRSRLTHQGRRSRPVKNSSLKSDPGKQAGMQTLLQEDTDSEQVYRFSQVSPTSLLLAR